MFRLKEPFIEYCTSHKQPTQQTITIISPPPPTSKEERMTRQPVLREFTDTICAWADKGHWYHFFKTHRDEYWICAHRKVCHIIHLCTYGTFCDPHGEVFLSRGQTKGIQEADLGLWQLLGLAIGKSGTSPCVNDLWIVGVDLYHVLSVNSLIQINPYIFHQFYI